MSEEEKKEQSPGDGRIESPKEVSGESSGVNTEASAEVNQSEIPQSEINMEVHHHPDLHHKRKNFREYFLEFLMIFPEIKPGIKNLSRKGLVFYNQPYCLILNCKGNENRIQ
jgi:hypothetical protein